MENKIVTFSVSSIGTTPIQLTKLPIGTCRVSMKPFSTNTASVYWNKTATVTPWTVDATDGFLIDNGDFTELCDPTTIYVVAWSAGQKISVKLEY